MPFAPSEVLLPAARSVGRENVFRPRKDGILVTLALCFHITESAPRRGVRGELLGKVFRAFWGFIRWVLSGAAGGRVWGGQDGIWEQSAAGRLQLHWEFSRDRVSVGSPSLIPARAGLKPPRASPLMGIKARSLCHKTLTPWLGNRAASEHPLQAVLGEERGIQELQDGVRHGSVLGEIINLRGEEGH